MAQTVRDLTQYFINGSMEGFVTVTTPLAQFSYAVNQDGAGLNDIIRVPFVNNASGSSDFTYASGYTIGQNNAVVGKSVTLGNIKYQVWDLPDSDLLKLTPQTATALGRAAGARLAADVVSGSFASLMGSFTQTSTYGAAGLTSSLALAELDKKANDANWPAFGRNMILNTTAKNNLMQNTSVVNAYAFGTPVQIDAQIPKVYGFNQYTVTCGLGAGVSGFAANPNAVLFGMAYHKPGDSATQVYSQPVIDQKTGLVFGYKEYYDPQYARTIRILDCLYGSAVGDATALIKLG